MRSMTGYGKTELIKDDQVVTIEIKSVNNRFLDFNVKLPKIFNFLEDSIRKEINKGISRGRVDLFINYVDNREQAKEISLDFALAKAYSDASKKLSKELSIENDLTTAYLLKTNDIVRIDKASINEEFLKDFVLECTKGAISNLNEMRDKEGFALKNVIIDLAKEIEKCVQQIKEYAPKVSEDYREKLANRIKEVLSQTEVDQARLLNEVAFFVDKSNIDEELARLDSHIKQLYSIMEETIPVGRKLDFLVQEFNREANTICSKSNNITITNIGLELKSNIEKVREQIQNIE